MLPSRVSNTKVSRCLLAKFNVGIIEGIGSTISQARLTNTSALPTKAMSEISHRGPRHSKPTAALPTTAMPEISQSGPGPWHGMPTAPPKQPPSFLLGGHGGATQRLLLIPRVLTTR